jgi:arylsulfatase
MNNSATVRGLVGALLLLIWLPSFGETGSRPNVVVLLSDNLGYGDLGAYGGGAIRGAPTPRIDQLAVEGLRLTNFNVELSCTPSRSALMTGRYAVRSGTGAATPVPGIPQGMAPWEITIAELLRDEGYDTALFGKWHLGASEGRYPTDQGFDEWWGFPNSTGIVNFARSVGYPKDRLPVSKVYEGTSSGGISVAGSYDYEGRRFVDETIQEKAIDYLEKPQRRREPFFLVVSWSLVHHPSMPHPDFEGRSGAGRFADALLEHDHRVGAVLDAIDANGLAEDTLVIYASDNGPDRAEYPWVGDTGPYLGYLGSAFEGSVRTPMIARWPGHISAGSQTNEIVAIHDIYPTLAALAGAELPDDRPIDGLDQSPLLLGTGDSARESVLFFSRYTLTAMKWRDFKVHFTGESADPDELAITEIWTPRIHHLLVDPKEANDITHKGYLWMYGIINQVLLPFRESIATHGIVETGGERPEPGTIRMPYFEQRGG